MRSTVIVFLGLLVVAIGAVFAVGQQQTPERAPPGSYAVASIGNGAVLLDTQSGKTWLLEHSADRLQPAAWLPATRIDNVDEAIAWRKTNQGRVAAARERDELEQRLSEMQRQYEQYKAVASSSGSVNARRQAIEKRIAETEARLRELGAQLTERN